MTLNDLKINDNYSSINLDDAIKHTLKIRKRIISSLLNEDFEREDIFELKGILERVRYLMLNTQEKNIIYNSEKLEKLTTKLEFDKENKKNASQELERSLRILDACYELMIENFPEMREKIKQFY